MIVRDWIFVSHTPRQASDQIIGEVAAKHGCTGRELRDGAGIHSLRQARYEAMYELRQRTTLSTTQIARKFGLKNHTSVLYATDKHAERLAMAEAA